MTYKLRFHEAALKEWTRLDPAIAGQFKKKLAERLENPRVAACALAGMPDCYKIKLRRVGYRLVYRVDTHAVFVTVIAVGRRDKSRVYHAAHHRNQKA